MMNGLRLDWFMFTWANSYINKWYQSWKSGLILKIWRFVLEIFVFMKFSFFQSNLQICWCFGLIFVIDLIVFENRISLCRFGFEISWFEVEFWKNRDFGKICVLEVFDQIDQIVVRIEVFAFINLVSVLISSRLV
jgi:hypothetical protein